MNRPISLSVDEALGRARQALGSDPRVATALAAKVLGVVPGHPLARLILGAGHRIVGETAEALDTLSALAAEQADSGPVWLEYGIALGEAGRAPEARAALTRATTLMPASPDAWRYLADALDEAGDSAGADNARARYLSAANRDPALMAAAASLVANDLPAADARLVAHLSTHPKDVAALRMRAEIASRLRRYADAQVLLEQCLELAPGFDAARHNYAVVLNRQGRAAEALPQVERLLAREPRNPGYRNLKGGVLAILGESAESIETYKSVLTEYPNQPKVWMSLGHALRAAGRQDEAVAAYRRSISLEPTLGEAYWSLANLKTVRFSPDDLEAMRSALGRDDVQAEDRLHFEFALGKALEDAKEYEASFAHYAAGNAMRRSLHPYSADDNTAYVARAKRLYTTEFFAAREAQGCAAADPIFILGLPRAGSTLLEQILASHPLVEGTMELPDLPQIAVELARRASDREGHGAEARAGAFEEVIAGLNSQELCSYGDRYIATTRAQRKTDRPFFIDKMPNNCLYVGLLHAILPNAKVIDARRHPMACCFSAFKQHFARGQNFSYSLDDVGRYYGDYVELMAHFDRVLPGRVHRVYYESLVENTESEVRRLLDYCGLPFDERCLRFYENDRNVRTASSEQVRRPINRDGMDHWRHFEPWLGPLKHALGPVLDNYPLVPDNF